MTDHERNSRRRRFSRANRFFLGPLILVPFGFMGIMLMIDTARAGIWFLVAFGALITLYSLYFGVAFLRLAVIVGPECVVVRNLVRTKRFPLSSVRDVTLGGLNYVYIVLTDGTSVQCTALAPTRFGSGKVPARFVDQIRAAIDEQRQQSTLPAGKRADPVGGTEHVPID